MTIEHQKPETVKLYFNFYNNVIDFLKDEVSQARILHGKHKIIFIEELCSYFNMFEPKEQIDLQTIDLETKKVIK